MTSPCYVLLLRSYSPDALGLFFYHVLAPLLPPNYLLYWKPCKQFAYSH